MSAHVERSVGALILILMLIAPAAARGFTEPELSWSDVLDRIEAHPDLAAARAGVEAAEGALRSVALPNPELELGRGRAEAIDGRETADTWELGLGISLRPWGPFRHQRAAARSHRRAAESKLAAVRLEVERELATRFWSIAHDQGLLAILGERREQLEELVEVARLRVKLGETRPADPLRLEIELERLATEIRRTELRARADRLGLALWIDPDLPADYRAAADWETVPPLPALERLQADLLRHPAMGVAGSERLGAEASLAAARADRLPGLELGAFVEREMDAEVKGLQLSFELPFLNRGGGAVAAAGAELAMARHGEDRLRRRLAAALAATHARAAGARVAVQGLRDVILPKAAANVAAFQRLYTVGEESLLELLAARQDLAAAETELLAARLNYRLALIELATFAGGIDHD